MPCEDLRNRQEALEDPRGFPSRHGKAPGVILDEVQRAPDLFSSIQGYVDDGRGGSFSADGLAAVCLNAPHDLALAY